ncbi:MAG: hypothetical protein ABIA67_03015 [Candidatus Margulisiibacteriota bacterium]
MKISGNRIYIYLIIIVVLFGCAQEPLQPKLIRSMVEFDQAYIPALIFTNLQKQRESELAVERLRKKWDKFNQKYYGLEIKYGKDITDKFWKEDFDQISALIVSAEGFVKQKKLSAARGKLEGIRVVLLELRSRNGLKYFLDGMTGFHNSMEGLILTLTGKDKLNDKDVFKLRLLFKEAQSSWTKVAGSEIDLLLFGFDPKKIEAVKKRIQEEEQGMASLAAALSSKDADRIFQAAQDLKPNFMVLYKAFGDFQPIFDKVVKERKEKETRLK